MGGRRILWIAGLVALVGALLYGHFRSTPYLIPWAWLSFMGLVTCEGAMDGTASTRWRWRLPDVTLLAAIIVFRKHPEVTALIALAAGAATGLIVREPWPSQVSRTAGWILASVLGSATFGVIGFADTPHFVAATAVLTAEFLLIETWGRVSLRLAVWVLGSGIGGAILALAVRSPGWADALVVRLGQLALLAAVGMLLGALLGSARAIAILRRPDWRRLPVPLALGFVLLILSVPLPAQASWLAAALGLLIVMRWVLTRRAFGPAAILLGGLFNEIARGANGGRMPVDVSQLPAAMQAEFRDAVHGSAGYVLAGAHSHLIFLADRFAAAPYPGVASLGDLTMAAGIVWWLAGTPGIPARATRVTDEPAIAA